MVAVTAVLIFFFVLKPVAKVLGARFFITDVTSDKCNMARRRNYRALKDVARALVDYNVNPKNAKFRYLSPETTEKLRGALEEGDKSRLKASLKQAYATEVASCVNRPYLEKRGESIFDNVRFSER